MRAVHTRRVEIRAHIERLESLGQLDTTTRSDIVTSRIELECLQEASKALWSDL